MSSIDRKTNNPRNFENFAATLITVLLLAGCAAAPKEKPDFDKALDAWVGRSLDSLVAEKGQPGNTFPLPGGAKVYEYTTTQDIVLGGGVNQTTQAAYKSGPTGAAYGTVASTQKNTEFKAQTTCRVLFKISDKNVVESWTADGNGCK